MRKTTPAVDRFWSKVQKTDTCWLWSAAKDDRGYGQFRVASAPAAPLKAHRFAYELIRGAVPDGLQLDHLCRVRHCVNPSHLEPVTSGVNTLRGDGPTAHNARKTHCDRGHELTWTRDGRRRRCFTCQEMRRRKAA